MATALQGVVLPIITPFTRGRVDITAYRQLLSYYLGKEIHGIIPLGTTGESPTIEEDESDQIVEAIVEIIGNKIPIYVGVSSNATNKAVHQIKALDRFNISGVKGHDIPHPGVMKIPHPVRLGSIHAGGGI